LAAQHPGPVRRLLSDKEIIATIPSRNVFLHTSWEVLDKTS